MGGLGCDNMTVIIVGLLQGGTYSELATRCSEKAVRNLSPSLDGRRTHKTPYGGLRDALYGDISEDPQNLDAVPHMVGVSKLNDTLLGSNTDLDNVIEIQRQSSKDEEDGSSTSPGSNGMDAVDNINVSHDSKLDILQPIETTV